MLTNTDMEYFQTHSNRLNPEQASRYLGPSIKTLAQWRYQGIGPCFTKIRGRVYYYKEDLDRWVEAQGRFTSTAEAMLARTSSESIIYK